jgi:hypothetical protein
MHIVVGNEEQCYPDRRQLGWVGAVGPAWISFTSIVPLIKKPPGNCRLSAAEEWRNGGYYGVRLCLTAVDTNVLLVLYS